MSLGQNIRRIRKNKGLSILQVREKTGLSKSTISDLETDKSSPTADTIQKIASALEVTVDEFFKEESSNEETGSNHSSFSHELFEKFASTEFTQPEAAFKYILAQPAMAAYGGYDLKQLSDEEILEIANDMLFALRLSLEKINKKRLK